MRIAGRLLIASSLVLASAAISVAGAAAATFTNSAPIAIPSNGTASPYPSQIDVAGQTTPISDLNVNLNGLTHDAPSDIQVLLVAPGGQAMLLMACVGNDMTPGAANANLKLDDSSGIRMPAFPSAVFSGTYKPTSYCSSAPTLPSPAPTGYANPGPGAGGGSTLASIFNNSGANGPWSLFVYDAFVGGNTGAQFAGGWSLEISPDPASAPGPAEPKKTCPKGSKLKKVKTKSGKTKKKCVRKKRKKR